LSGRGEPFTFIFARPFDSFFFWHNAKVSLWHPLLDVKLISPKVRAIDSESFRKLTLIALDTAFHVQREKQVRAGVLNSNCGKHCGHPFTQTKIQRYEPDRIMVHGVTRLHPNRGKGSAPSEKSVCR
jgi:hypothetical protein